MVPVHSIPVPEDDDLELESVVPSERAVSWAWSELKRMFGFDRRLNMEMRKVAPKV